MQDGQFRGFNLPQANSGADFDLFRAIFGTVQGFISGFTTIPFGEEPKNSGEAIFRNVGHLLGFMGYIPGPGSLGKLGATAVANVVGRTGLVAKGLVTAGRVEEGIRKVAEFSSVPMMGANLIMKGMERYGLSKAGGLATRFMEKRLGTKAGVVFENAMKSGIHLGLASGISAAPPWQLAVDQRMEAFMGGFGAGAFFGGTGELLPTKGITANDNILQQIMKSVKDPKGVARILSTTAYMGLPSTLSQDPIELQVYAYLQGALFGSTSLAQHDKDAIAFIRGQHQESNTPQFLLNRMLLDPEKMNGWKELTPKAQETVKEQVNLMHIKYLASADNITFASGSQAKALKEIVDTASKELEELDLNRSKYSDKEYQERKERLVASMTNADDADHFIKYLEDHKDKSVEENWDNFGKEVIAANAREMSMSLETIRANQNKEMQDKLYGNLAEGTPDGKEISQLNQYMTDVKKMPPIYREPVRMLAKGLMGKDQSVEGRIQKQKEIVDLIDEHRGNWDEMISAFNKKYNVKLEPSTRTHTNEAYNALRNAYITEKYVIPSPLPQLSVDPVTGKTYEIKYTNANGDNVAQYKANPFMKKVLEEAFRMSDIGFRNVKYVRVRKTLKSGATVEADEPIYDGNFDFLKTSEEMHKQGMTIFGGVKDDANLIAIKYLLPGDTMALKKIAADKILEDFFQKEPEAKKVFDELWEKRKKELNLPDGHQRLLTQLEIYQMQYANNIKALEAINGGVSIHEILKGDGFIKSPVALNKRLSLLNNGFIPLDKEYFKERPYFKTAIVRAVPGKRGRDESDDFAKSIVEGKEDIWEYRLNSQGKLVKKKMDTDRDGVIYLHDKVFDKLTQFAGLEVGTGAQKGTLTHTDSNGALFGKYAYHRAGSELSKAMEEHGLDSIIYDTAAKQTGKRTVHDMRWDNGKLVFGEEVKPSQGKLYGMLDDIAKNTSNPKYAKLARYLRSIASDIPVSEDKELTTAARYSALSDDIAINPERTKSYNPDHIILHETVHSVLHYKIATWLFDKEDTSLTANERSAINDLDTIRKNVIGRADKELYSKFMELQKKRKQEVLSTEEQSFFDKHRSRFYGLSNLQEFIAETMTNPEFQKQLKNKYENGINLWDKFKTTVKKLFGITGKDTELSQALSDILELTEPMVKPAEVKQGPEFYDLPVESFTITNAGEHLRSQMKESYFVSQFLSNLDNRMPQTSGWIKREMEKVVDGDKYHNAIARNYLAGKSKNIDKLDISKISHEIKLKVLFGGQNNELYRKLIDHYLKRDKETMVDEDDLPLNFNQEKVYRDALDRPQSGAERLLQLWKLNPQKAMSRPLQSYINTIIASQMKAELFRPRAEGSWRSKLAPLGILNGKYDLKPGEVLLDKALGKKEIPWVDNTKITIKKALELRDKEQDPMVKEQMDEALSIAFQRVPTSALSGVRILKIKALTDIDGSGVRLHPKDMVNADGADLDIDGGYIYTNLPKMVKDEFRNVQNEWYDYYDIKTGKKLDSKYADKLGWKKIKELVDKGELAEVYSDPKSGDDFVDKSRMNKYLKDKYAMLDPYTLMEANKNAYKGNELLGLGVGTARHINAMLMDRKDIDPKVFLRAKRSLINYAADAADGIPLVSKDKIRNILLKAAFGERTAHAFELLTEPNPKKNPTREDRTIWFIHKKNNMENEGYSKEEILQTQIMVEDFYDKVNMNKIIKGQDDGQHLSLGEMAKRSSKLAESDNPYYRAGWLVGNWGNALDRLDYLPGISDKGGEMNQRIVNVWSRTKGFKELIGRYAVNVLNKSMRSKAFKEKAMLSHFDAFQYANELNSQDLWDALSIKLIREFAPKNYDPMIVEKIRRDVFALKIKLREAMQQRREAGFTSGGAKQAIEAEYIKLKQGFQGVPEYLDLIDAYMVSSLYPQEMNLEAYMKQDKPSLFWQSAIEETRGKINQRQKDGQPVSELKQHLKELEDNYEQAQIEAKQAWYYTNTDAVGYEMQSVSNKVLIRAGELYDEIAVMRDRQLSDHDIREIDEYVDNSKLTEDLEVSDMPTFKSDFIYKVKDIAAKYEEELKKSPDPQLEKASDIILKFFQKYPNKIKDYQAIFEGDMFRRGLETGMPGAIAPNIASPQDVIDFANTLESIMQSKGSFRKLRRMDYARSFGSIGNEMLASEPGSYVTKVPVLVDNTMLPKFKEVRVMQSTFGKVNGFWKKEDELTSGSYQKIDNSFENTYKLRNWLNEQEHGLGDKMYAYMFANAEKEVGFKLSQEDNNEHYRRYEAMKTEGEKMLSGDKKYRAPWMEEEKTLRQIFDDLNLWMEETNRRQADEYIRGQKAVEKFILKYKMRYDLFLPNSEFLNLKGLKKALTEEWNSSKPLMLGWDMLNRIYWQEHVESIKIDPVKFFNTYFNTRGRRMAEEWVQLQDEFKSDVKVESTEPSPVVEFKDLTALTSHPLFHEIGKTIFVGKHPLDIVAKVLYGRMTAKDPVYDTKVSELLDDNAKATLLNMMNKDGKLNYEPIQLMDFKTRVPHMDHDPKEVKVWLENRLLSLKATSAKPQDLILAKMNALETLDRSNLQSVEYAANLEDMLNRGGITTEEAKTFRMKAGTTLHRSQEDPTPGWSLMPEIFAKSEKQLISNYNKGIAAWLSHRNLKEIEINKSLGENTEAWTVFGHQYVRRNVGLPSLFPKEWLDKKEYFIKNNPYYYLTDQYWVDRLEGQMSRHFGGKSPFGKILKDFSKEELEKLTPRDLAAIKKFQSANVTRMIGKFSELEAKWSFLSLLTHSKTMVANIFGGSQLTMASTGLRNFLQARDYNYLRENVFLDAKSKADIDKIAEENGSIESLFKSEVTLNNYFKTGRGKDFAEEIVRYIDRGGKLDEDVMRKYAKQYGVSDVLMNTGGWFMRKSEIMLRKHAWFAHYLNAWKTLGMTALDMPADHPWLIDWANRGVAATQFLYNTASRPAFASTTLGRVFTRFQMWTWNSLKFRTDVFKIAGEHGIRPGSAEFNRARRLLTMDLFVLGLAGLFPSTLFENTLAPPFNYFTNLSQYFFGDDDQKKRAFFGSMPYPFNILQMGLPPSSRVLTGTFKFIWDGDMDAYGRQVISWVPFGRFANDIRKTYESPIMGINNLTGFPSVQLQRVVNKSNKEEEKGTKRESPLPKSLINHLLF